MTSYIPHAYLIEGVPSEALGMRGVAFQHRLSPELFRLSAAGDDGEAGLAAWLDRCSLRHLRPMVLFEAYDSPLATAFRHIYARSSLEDVEWMVWPPEPEAMTRILRDPDPDVLEMLASAWAGQTATASAADGHVVAGSWHTPLIDRLRIWLTDFGTPLQRHFGSMPAARSIPTSVMASLGRRFVRTDPLELADVAAGERDRPVEKDIGAYSLSREDVPGSPEQYLILRCRQGFIEPLHGRVVEVQIGPDVFVLGTINSRGRVETKVPRGLDMTQRIEVRIFEPDASEM